MEPTFSPFPFVRLLMPFCLGIVAGIQVDFPSFTEAIWYGAILLYLLLWWMQKRRKSYRIPIAMGATAVLICFLFGTLLTHQHQPDRAKDHISHIDPLWNVKAFRADVISPVQETEKTYKVIVALRAVQVDSVWQPVSGKAYTYFSKEVVQPPATGMRLTLSSTLRLIDPPGNPGAFDYQAYSQRKGIYAQTYVRPGQYKVWTKLAPSSWWQHITFAAGRATQQLEQRLVQHFESSREAGIVKALVLGVKDDLQNDVTEAYSGTGAMHVLAVSGLHVGLVYQIFVWLFGWLKSRNVSVNRFVQCGILLLCIWTYAFITGLSPSVTRASTMFSFIVLADAFGRRTNIFNTIAVSAFFLLLINPFLITEVGFQLSYLAVIAIVYIYPKIHPLLSFNNGLANTLWSWTCVSIAAQVGTFALGLFYFRQFPSYFFLSNIAVIPGAVLILYLGLATLAFSGVSIIASALTWLLEKIVWLLNEAVFLLHQLPHAVIEHVYLTPLQCGLIYLTIVLFFVFLYARNLRWYGAMIAVVMWLAIIQTQRNIRQSVAQQVAFYSMSDNTAVGLIRSRSVQVLSDTLWTAEDEQVQYNMQPHWESHGIVASFFHDFDENAPRFVRNWEGNYLVQWQGRSFLFYGNEYSGELTTPLFFDYLIVCNDVWLDKEKMRRNFRFSKMIVDGSSSWKTRRFCRKAFSDAVDVIEKGALLDNL